MKKIGLVINPIAGIGGKAGLKGSDGEHIQKLASEMGIAREAGKRAEMALNMLLPYKDRFELRVAPGEMGEQAADSLGFKYKVIGKTQKKTSADDTISISRKMLEHGVDMILFAGGDGTARNILDAVGSEVPVLGIPAGVKIHSGVYAINPISAGKLCQAFLEGRSGIEKVEIMDLDEDEFRNNHVCARLYGYVNAVSEKGLLQNPKAGSYSEKESLAGIAEEIATNIRPEDVYIIGSGTTAQSVMDRLGLKNTLLGVDVIKDGRVIAQDVNEPELYNLIKSFSENCHLVLTIIGGQGHIFGRGNQQISPRIIRLLKRANIHIIAPKSKIVALRGRPFIIDTGDDELDKNLSGYYRVISGFEDYIVYKAEC